MLPLGFGALGFRGPGLASRDSQVWPSRKTESASLHSQEPRRTRPQLRVQALCQAAEHLPR